MEINIFIYLYFYTLNTIDVEFRISQYFLIIALKWGVEVCWVRVENQSDLKL